MAPEIRMIWNIRLFFLLGIISVQSFNIKFPDFKDNQECETHIIFFAVARKLCGFSWDVSTTHAVQTTGYSKQQHLTRLSWSQLNSSIKNSRTHPSPFCLLITGRIGSWVVWKQKQKIFSFQQWLWSRLERTSGYIVQIQKVSFSYLESHEVNRTKMEEKTAVLSSRDSSFEKKNFLFHSIFSSIVVSWFEQRQHLSKSNSL